MYIPKTFRILLTNYSKWFCKTIVYYINIYFYRKIVLKYVQVFIINI